jgi:hypothetical protein
MKISPMDEIIPSGLRVHDSVRTPSSTIDFPGFSTDSSSFNLQTGFFTNDAIVADNTSHPLTIHDDASTARFPLTPYLTVEKSIAGIKTGVYLGNIQTDFATYHASSPADTVSTYNKEAVTLHGALWCIPNVKYVKGLSFRGEGNYRTRATHFTNNDEWKKIHTFHDYERKYIKGVFTAGFSFWENDFWIVRLMYGKNITDAEERRADTLFFSNDNYLHSNERIVGSFETSSPGMEIGHLYALPARKMTIGCIVGADRTNIDYENAESDSSTVFFNGFIEKKYDVRGFTFFTGIDLLYSGTFFGHSDQWIGYGQLARDYSMKRMAHNLKIKAPLFSILSIGTKIRLMTGAECSLDYRKSNHDFLSKSSKKRLDAGFDIELYPLNIEYSPSKNWSLAFSPAINDDIVAGCFELRYGF